MMVQARSSPLVAMGLSPSGRLSCSSTTEVDGAFPLLVTVSVYVAVPPSFRVSVFTDLRRDRSGPTTSDVVIVLVSFRGRRSPRMRTCALLRMSPCADGAMATRRVTLLESPGPSAAACVQVTNCFSAEQFHPAPVAPWKRSTLLSGSATSNGAMVDSKPTLRTVS